MSGILDTRIQTYCNSAPHLKKKLWTTTAFSSFSPPVPFGTSVALLNTYAIVSRWTWGYLPFFHDPPQKRVLTRVSECNRLPLGTFSRPKKFLLELQFSENTHTIIAITWGRTSWPSPQGGVHLLHWLLLLLLLLFEPVLPCTSPLGGSWTSLSWIIIGTLVGKGDNSRHDEHESRSNASAHGKKFHLSTRLTVGQLGKYQLRLLLK